MSLAHDEEARKAAAAALATQERHEQAIAELFASIAELTAEVVKLRAALPRPTSTVEVG